MSFQPALPPWLTKAVEDAGDATVILKPGDRPFVIKSKAPYHLGTQPMTNLTMEGLAQQILSEDAQQALSKGENVEETLDGSISVNAVRLDHDIVIKLRNAAGGIKEPEVDEVAQQLEEETRIIKAETAQALREAAAKAHQASLQKPSPPPSAAASAAAPRPAFVVQNAGGESVADIELPVEEDAVDTFIATLSPAAASTANAAVETVFEESASQPAGRTSAFARLSKFFNSSAAASEREEAARREQEEAARRAEEDAARRAQEEAARRAQEEAARREQEDAARREQEEAARREQEDAARRAQEDAARREQEEATRREQEEAARLDLEEKARRAQEEAEAVRRELAEVARRAQEEAARREQEEAARLALEEAARREHEEAARRAREEAARREQDEAARRDLEQMARRAQEEAEAARRELAEVARRAQEDAARLALEEVARREQEAAARRAQEDAARREQEEAARRDLEEKTRRAQDEAEAARRELAEVTRRAQEEATRRGHEEAARREQEDAARRVREEAARRERDEAERRELEELALRAKREAEAARRELAEVTRRAQEEAARREQDKAERREQERADRREQEDAARRELEQVAQRIKEEAARRAVKDAARQRMQAAEENESDPVTESMPARATVVELNRRGPLAAATELTDWILEAMDQGATALYLRAGKAPFARIDGQVEILAVEPIPLSMFERAGAMMTAGEDGWHPAGEWAWSKHIPGTGSVHCQAFSDGQGGGFIVQLPVSAAALDEQVPRHIRNACETGEGLIVVSAPFAEDVAAMVGAVVAWSARRRAGHIISFGTNGSLERVAGNAFVSDRPLPSGDHGMTTALHGALRERPDMLVVIASGPLPAVHTLISAAVGRLVIVGLVARTAPRALEILLNQVGSERHLLAANFKAACSWRGFRTAAERRLVISDTLVATDRVSALIEAGDIAGLHRAQANRDEGMRAVDAALAAAVGRKKISLREAAACAVDRKSLISLVRRQGQERRAAERDEQSALQRASVLRTINGGT